MYATKQQRNDYNKAYQHHTPAGYYFSQLRDMGHAKVTQLPEDNGHVCEEIPTCYSRARIELKFRSEIVRLCQAGYERYKNNKA